MEGVLSQISNLEKSVNKIQVSIVSVMISGSTRKDMCTARGLEAIDGLKLLVFTSYLCFIRLHRL